MALDKTIIPPSEATEIAQAGFDFVNKLLPFAQMFPMKSNEGDWTVTWTPNLPVVKTRAMQRRALDAEVPHVKSTEVSAEQHTGLLPLSGMGHITEREVAKASKQKSATDYVHDKAENLFEQMGREAAVTLELERIQAMMDATIKIKEGDDRASELVTYSFGRPSKQQDVVPTVKWSDPKADVFTDLKKWVKLMRTARGRAPHAVLTTSAVIDALTANEQMRTAFSKMDLEHSPVRLSRADVENILRERLQLTDIRYIDELYESLSLDNNFEMNVDTATLIPDSTFILFPSYNDDSLGFTASGPTAEGQDAEFELGKNVNDGLVAYMMHHYAPANYDLWVNGTALPVLQDAVSTFKAKVL